MSNQRFGAGQNLKTGEAFIIDELKKCPITELECQSFDQAVEIADWLNKNVTEYRRFVVGEHKSENGRYYYNLYDNEKEEYVKFIPQIQERTVKAGLQHWADFLNELWEGNK